MNNAVSTCLGRLRANNPDRKYIDVPLGYFQTADEVTQFCEALDRNEWISYMDFSFLVPDHRARGDGEADQTPVLNWDPLLRAIENREKLTKVGVTDTPPGTGRLFELFRNQLMQAVQRNTHVQSLSLVRMDFSNESTDGIISYLDSTPHLTDLTLAAGRDDSETKRIASALQRNTNIRNLRLRFCRDPFHIPIFEKIASPDSVLYLNKLVFHVLWIGTGSSPAVCEALRHCLENSKIKCFELDGSALRVNVGLSNIIKGLIQSTSVKEVVFSNFTVQQRDDVYCEHLCNLLREKTNLSTMRLLSSNFFRFRKCLDGFVEGLTKNDSSLRCLEFDLFDTIDLPRFQDLMRIVASSQLEVLFLCSIPRRYPDYYLQALASAIPFFKVHAINLAMCGGGWTVEDEELLLDAFKNNYIVQSVDCKRVGGSRNSWFSERNQRRLDFFLDRNRKLEQWTANPKLVPPELWTYALNLALKAGINSLYQSLLAVSGDGVGLRQKQSSRKRTR